MVEKSSTGPSLRMTACSMAWASSRMLPFHWRSLSSCMSRSRMGRWGRPNSRANFWAKWRASMGMSPVLSLREGRKMGNALRRKKRSARNRPAATSFCRSRLLAAMTRTLMGISSPPPMRSISRSWRTRSIFDWSSRGSSPISSRKMVPPSASSNLPIRRPVAPVKLPFS